MDSQGRTFSVPNHAALNCSAAPRKPKDPSSDLNGGEIALPVFSARTPPAEIPKQPSSLDVPTATNQGRASASSTAVSTR